MASHIFRLEGVVVKIDGGLRADDVSLSSSHYFYESRDIIFYLRHALRHNASRARPTVKGKKMDKECDAWVVPFLVLMMDESI